MVEKYYSEQLADIYCGHAIDVLKSLPSESVQLCITSPPYWGLRAYAGGSDIVWGDDPQCDHVWEGSEYHEHREETKSGKTRTTERFYGEPSRKFDGDHQKHYSNVFCVKCKSWRGQLGLESTPELYVEHLLLIFREVKRVLKREGSFWLNLGDTYSASWGNMSHEPARDYPEGRPPQSYKLSVQPKCMVCIPERVMFAMISEGWILRNKNIWHKSNSMPGSQKDRLTCTWEYLYFFVKNNSPVLWRNRETGEWRDKRPTKDENYPWGGMYYNEERNEFRWDKPPEAEKDNWAKLQPLWMSFDYYFDLDQIRQPHKTQSLERYQRQVNFGDRTPASKYADTNPYPEGTQPIYREGRNLCPDWFKEMFPEDKDYKGKFDNPNWRKEAAKKGQLFDQPVAHQGGGNTGLGKHHGSSHDGRAGFDREHWVRPSRASMPGRDELGNTPPKEARDRPLVAPHHRYRGDGWERQAIEGRKPKIKHDIAVGRTGNVSYTDPLHTKDYSPKGKNPGDFWEITTKPSSICVCPKCETVFPRYTKTCPQCGAEGVTGHFAPYPERLCEDPIRACSRVGDTVLDPLAGGGTTGVAAKRLGRKAILIDVVKEYCIMAKERVSKVEYQPELEFK